MAQLTDLETALGAIGTKEETYDLSGFAENPWKMGKDGIPVLRHITGLEPFDAAGVAQCDLNADGVVDQVDLEAGMQFGVGIDPNVANTGLYKEFVDQNQNLTTQFADQNTNLTNQFGDLNTRFDTVDTDVGDNLTAITDVSDQVTGVQTTADTIDTNTKGLGQGISDLSTAQTSRFDTLDTGFVDAKDQLTTTQTNVLDGQKDLDDALTTMSSNNDISSTSILDNQTTMQEGQDGFVSNFDDYVARYGEDVSLANKFRTDLEQAQTDAFGQIRNDVSGFANSVSNDNFAINNALNSTSSAPANILGVNSTFGTGDTDTDTATSGAAAPPGFNAQNGTLGAKSRELANMVSQVQSLNPTQRQDLRSVISAFDPQGNLVRSSFRKNGITTIRAIDSNGNLIMRDFEPSGREVANKVLSIPDQLAFLGQYGTLPKANVGMGNLSPSVNTNYSGYVSPYTQTG